MAFYVFFFVIVIQRLIELVIAHKNEKWMKEQGALEFGKGHYPYMVLMHILFFLVLFIESVFFVKEISAFWIPLVGVFLLTQAIRIWALSSLGKYWNTKIIVLPNASVVKKGPYRFLKHPNYVIVTIELLIIPLIFKAYFTLILFAILNFIILSIRIPEEEKALNSLTTYDGTFAESNRFVPKL
ncbi:MULTISPECIES: isoprenylcysteine carboxyl methyltransferase family protein [unclassified Bacillus (in: firmicutes)]|uniref:isoprenylcysteine carboxyl methyltransferase family protein n=1 Tax=unclassified Bacillus (in: firmicutes) TaxID=185979 RepID=UPI000B863A9B|nr:MULTISPECIES: isoprenylcysteine carboxylmethyltransferase family protein [unclassified Bacillus (in: firmicutes)]